jgi:hypothetical protein
MFPKVKWTASPSGEVIVGCPTEYVIDRIQPDGDVIRISHERDPMIEPDGGRRFFVESWEWVRDQQGHDWHWPGPDPPARKPFYDRLLVGRGGRLWVWPGLPTEPIPNQGPPFGTTWRAPRTGAFDVFDVDGRFLGPVLLPDGAEYRPFPGRQEPFVSGDTVWLIRRDSMDVKYIDRMVIRW